MIPLYLTFHASSNTWIFYSQDGVKERREIRIQAADEQRDTQAEAANHEYNFQIDATHRKWNRQIQTIKQGKVAQLGANETLIDAVNQGRDARIRTARQRWSRQLRAIKNYYRSRSNAINGEEEALIRTANRKWRKKIEDIKAHHQFRYTTVRGYSETQSGAILDEKRKARLEVASQMWDDEILAINKEREARLGAINQVRDAQIDIINHWAVDQIQAIRLGWKSRVLAVFDGKAHSKPHLGDQVLLAQGSQKIINPCFVEGFTGLNIRSFVAEKLAFDPTKA